MVERVFGMGLLAVMLLSGCATMTGGGPSTKLTVAFNDTAWDGARIPDGMQCAGQGGTKPASPPLLVSDIPQNTARLVIEFNDESYAPLSKGGGHGKFTVDVAGRDEVIVPPYTEGQGYRAPCSGKQNHVYSVTVHAMSAANQELARGYAPLGRY